MLVTTIQARMGSTRLPGKMLMDIGGRSTLAWVIRAAKEASGDAVVVATSSGSEDDPIAQAAESEGVSCIRGPGEDVLARFRLVAQETGAEGLIRITGDCPFLDPTVVDAVVGLFLSTELDYVGTIVPRTLPPGFDAEVLGTAALKRIDQEAKGHHRSHVTSYAYTHPELFRTAGVTFAPPADDLRVTLDTPEDLEFLRALSAELGDGIPSWRHVVEVLRERPDLREINAHIGQKDLAQG